MYHIRLVFLVCAFIVFKNLHLKGIKEHSTKVRQSCTGINFSCQIPSRIASYP